MSDKTGIEWTDATWNVASGCTRVSAGCDHCYIARTPPFRMAGRKFDGEGPGSSTGVILHPHRLDQPLRWRKPRRIFVNSLTDLFHDEMPDNYIARTFAVMALAPSHTFQVLTKRHARMRSLLSRGDFRDQVAVEITNLMAAGTRLRGARVKVDRTDETGNVWGPEVWPLPNVWLGVSVETQQWADIRIPALLETPAAVRFLSMEPLLGPVTFRWAKWNPWVNSSHLDGLRSLDWVIVGGESGPAARPMHPVWVDTIRAECVEADVPFLFKQWGEWQDRPAAPGQRGEDHIIVMDGRHEPANEHWAEDDKGRWTSDLIRARNLHKAGTERATFISRVGKKAAGRELDGRTWDEFPGQVPA